MNSFPLLTLPQNPQTYVWRWVKTWSPTKPAVVPGWSPGANNPQPFGQVAIYYTMARHGGHWMALAGQQAHWMSTKAEFRTRQVLHTHLKVNMEHMNVTVNTVTRKDTQV